MSDVRLINPVIEQGTDEEIVYQFDFAKWGTPSAPVVTLTDEAGVDVSSTKLSGTSTVSGTVVSTKLVTGLIAGTLYTLRVLVTIGENKESVKLRIRGAD